jgi:hypothetical protein
MKKIFQFSVVAILEAIDAYSEGASVHFAWPKGLAR